MVMVHREVVPREPNDAQDTTILPNVSGRDRRWRGDRHVPQALQRGPITSSRPAQARHVGHQAPQVAVVGRPCGSPMPMEWKPRHNGIALVKYLRSLACKGRQRLCPWRWERPMVTCVVAPIPGATRTMPTRRRPCALLSTPASMHMHSTSSAAVPLQPLSLTQQASVPRSLVYASLEPLDYMPPQSSLMPSWSSLPPCGPLSMPLLCSSMSLVDAAGVLATLFVVVAGRVQARFATVVLVSVRVESRRAHAAACLVPIAHIEVLAVLALVVQALVERGITDVKHLSCAAIPSRATICRTHGHARARTSASPGPPAACICKPVFATPSAVQSAKSNASRTCANKRDAHSRVM